MSAHVSARIFVGDTRVDNIDVDNRGLAYGDGLFETMRAHDSSIHWWPAHWARLTAGAARLRIPLPREAQVLAEIEASLDAFSRREQQAQDQQAQGQLKHKPHAAVVKLMLTRGSGGTRGYAPSLEAAPVWLLSTHSLPPPPRGDGLVLRWCDTRLATQPALAGLKHCNRLEQVLARGEWNDPGIDDGLMCDSDGDVIAATAGNLFVYRDGGWLTPHLDRCGIAGVCRGWAIAALDAEQCRLRPSDVETAEAVFLCNAVRGILPVAQLGDRRWLRHPSLHVGQRRLAAAHPAFVIATGANVTHSSENLP